MRKHRDPRHACCVLIPNLSLYKRRDESHKILGKAKGGGDESREAKPRDEKKKHSVCHLDGLLAAVVVGDGGGGALGAADDSRTRAGADLLQPVGDGGHVGDILESHDVGGETSDVRRCYIDKQSVFGVFLP